MRYAAILMLLATPASAQWSPNAIVVGNGAIRVYTDRVEFDWPRVRACAMSGDTVCRVAQAAKEGR